MAKDKEYNELIHSVAWLRTRKQKLQKNLWCEICWSHGRLTPATCVHHVTPVETATTYNEKVRLMFNQGNLQSLCASCHAEVHKELGSFNKKAMKERRIKNELERMEGYFRDDTEPMKGAGVFPLTTISYKSHRPAEKNREVKNNSNPH